MVQGHRKGRVRRAGCDEDCGELDQEHHVTLDLPCEMRSQDYQASTFARELGHLDFNVASPI